MTIDQALTDQERAAELDEAQLRQLIGLVEHDVSRDPFPISGWDALVWTVGNATQAALFFQAVYGMELVAYAGPETGLRDHVSYVLRSGAVRFVLNGAVRPDSPLVAVHGRHGDGICDIALQALDVDKCVAHARATGVTFAAVWWLAYVLSQLAEVRIFAADSLAERLQDGWRGRPRFLWVTSISTSRLRMRSAALS